MREWLVHSFLGLAFLFFLQSKWSNGFKIGMRSHRVTKRHERIRKEIQFRARGEKLINFCRIVNSFWTVMDIPSGIFTPSVDSSVKFISQVESNSYVRREFCTFSELPPFQLDIISVVLPTFMISALYLIRTAKCVKHPYLRRLLRILA